MCKNTIVRYFAIDYVVSEKKDDPRHRRALFSCFLRGNVIVSKAVSGDGEAVIAIPVYTLKNNSTIVGVWGGSIDFGILNKELQSLVNLGINTTSTAPDPGALLPINKASVEWLGLDISEVQTTMNNAGLKWRSAGTAATIFFDFVPLDTTQLNNWTVSLKSCYGDSLVNFVNLQLYDEPGWYYGIPGQTNMLEFVNSDQIYLGNFRNYLSSLPQVVQGTYTYSDFVHVGPGDPPATSRSDSRIIATGGSAINQSAETRRLFFWTMRFFVESASKGTSSAKNAPNISPRPCHRLVVFCCNVFVSEV